MVTDNHYRWDFIQLSTDEKPTPATSPKVADGSTLYTSDDSKLYVWYKDQWYEKTVEGGGGSSYTAGDGIDITNSTISVDTETIQPKLTAGTNITIDNNVISASGGGGDTVYSDKSTSDSTTGGAVYIGNLDSNQEEQPDPTTVDVHYRYFWALPYNNTQKPQNGSINIFGQNDGSSAITLGSNAVARLDGQLAIGEATLNNYSATNGIAIGKSAQCLNAYSVAIGKSAKTTRDGEVNFGAGTSGDGFNNTNYRVIGGVHDGVNAHDAATYGQVISYSAINGAGAPTTATEGKYVGQLYYDTTNEAMYFLKAIDTTTTPTSYTWEALGGGSSVNVVQTTGTSTTDVMSQNAVTSMVFADPSTTRKIQIGNNSYTISSDGISIGYASSAGSSSAQNCIAIGPSAIINGGKIGSVALGANSGGNITKSGMVDIGSAFTSYGYEGNSNYRLLTGLYEPQTAHDAATKGYVDNLIATLEARVAALEGN